MTTAAPLATTYLIPEKALSKTFDTIRMQLKTSENPDNPDASIIGWSTPTLQEINPRVMRSLENKYSACQKSGFKAAKVAGLYAFWIAKLKPIFSPFTHFRGLNEYAGLNVGIGYITERINIEISIDKEEVFDLCDTLRYHTSSPHAMMHLFTLLTERQKLKHKLSIAEDKLKKHHIS